VYKRQPFGFAELEGVHARGNYDLTQHSNASGQDLTYVDKKTNERYLPHVIESSVGVGRTVLAALIDAYKKEATDKGDERLVLKLHPKLSPIKVAVFPLAKNKPDLVEKARKVHDELSEEFTTEWDDNGNTGKRYRRQDEVGTPMCATIDFQTLEDGTLTIRDRDTMQQVRVNQSQVDSFVRDELKKPYKKK